jgi:hypothetical protein
MRPSLAGPLAKLTNTNTDPTLRTAAGACNWRLSGLEITQTSPLSVEAYGILRLGYGNTDGQTTLASVPHDIILDRLYVHAGPQTNARRCVVLDAANVILRDSWLDECHSPTGDAQAVFGANGPGPILIENNTLVGSGENIMFGGADPAIAEMGPQDITIRRNHVYKPLAWKVGTPTRANGPWCVKNLFELKNARRVLVEQNVFEHSWPDCQNGMAIVIKMATGSPNTTVTGQGTTDVMFRDNLVRDASIGLNLQAENCEPVCGTFPVTRVAVVGNAFVEIGTTGDAQLMLLTHRLTDVRIDSNVFAHTASVATSKGSAVMFAYSGGQAKRLSFTGNLIASSGAYGVFADGGTYGSAAFATMVADGSWRFVGNTLVGSTWAASKYPPGNLYTDTPVPLDLTTVTAKTAGVVVVPP